MNYFWRFFCTLIFFISGSAFASEWELRIESGAFWQGRNDFRVPGNSGSLVSIPKVGGDSARFVYRFNASKTFRENHQIRLTIAPLSFKQAGRLPNPVQFDGTEFSKNTPTELTYRFNSYRIGYVYTFVSSKAWTLKLGLTAKVRDAKIGLSQGLLSRENTNVGFVPLISIYSAYNFSEKTFLELDIDALAAPQGRAEDIRLSVVHFPIENLGLDIGYRTLEGGADNDNVYTFSWFHYFVGGLRFVF